MGFGAETLVAGRSSGAPLGAKRAGARVSAANTHLNQILMGANLVLSKPSETRAEFKQMQFVRRTVAMLVFLLSLIHI